MSEAFICEGTRTPIGKFGGSLSSIRTDDLASLPLISLKEKLSKTDWENLEVLFSNEKVPGEGEHKIFKYMKNADYGDNDKLIIYGLDADLIMLSMVSHINNIFLLREKTQFGSYCFQIDGYEFMYLDIDILKTCLLDEFTNYINDIKYEDIVRLIDDYVFLMFIIGNDFIPKKKLILSKAFTVLYKKLFFFKFKLKSDLDVKQAIN